jgi:hypothetical protein
MASATRLSLPHLLLALFFHQDGLVCDAAQLLDFAEQRDVRFCFLVAIKLSLGLAHPVQNVGEDNVVLNVLPFNVAQLDDVLVHKSLPLPRPGQREAVLPVVPLGEELLDGTSASPADLDGVAAPAQFGLPEEGVEFEDFLLSAIGDDLPRNVPRGHGHFGIPGVEQDRPGKIDILSMTLHFEQIHP